MSDLVPIPSPGVALTFGALGDPVVVVVHDRYGRLPWLTPFSEALASKGFRVVVPDLYDGVCTTNDETAASLSWNVDPTSALAELDSVVAEAHSEGSARTGVIGFERGGELALEYAQLGSADAVVAYDAILDAEHADVIPCPVLLQCSAAHQDRDGSSRADFEARLKDHGTSLSRYSYVSAGDFFANASLPSRVDPQSAALAFARTAVFLEKHLRD